MIDDKFKDLVLSEIRAVESKGVKVDFDYVTRAYKKYEYEIGLRKIRDSLYFNDCEVGKL